MYEDLVAGNVVEIARRSYGTDVIPQEKFEKKYYDKTICETLFYLSHVMLIKTTLCRELIGYNILYMTWDVRPRMANANYATSGQLVPCLMILITGLIGIGTRIFLGGAQGFVAWARITPA